MVRQVRLDDDVADVLEGMQGSLSKAANSVLRPALGLPPKSKRVRAAATQVVERVHEPQQSETMHRPTVRHNARASGPPQRCAHPVTRRIAGICLACGKQVTR